MHLSPHRRQNQQAGQGGDTFEGLKLQDHTYDEVKDNIKRSQGKVQKMERGEMSGRRLLSRGTCLPKKCVGGDEEQRQAGGRHAGSLCYH